MPWPGTTRCGQALRIRSMLRCNQRLMIYGLSWVKVTIIFTNRGMSKTLWYRVTLYSQHVLIGIICVHPKLRNINLHNVTHSLLSQNPRERLFVVQISLLFVTFLSLISQNLSIMQNHQRSQPTPSHCIMCQHVECLLLLLLLFHLLNVGACVRHIA